MRSNGEFLGRGAVGAKSARRRNDPTKPSERGSDPLVAAYERGPFPELEVAPFPVGLLALLERRTGRPADVALLAEYERIRAYMEYAGIEHDPRRATAPGDPRREGIPAVAAPRASARRATERDAHKGSRPPDPNDLGDD